MVRECSSPISIFILAGLICVPLALCTRYAFSRNDPLPSARKTKDIVHVQRLLGHRNIQNTLRYINLEQAIFKETTDQFHVKVVDSIDDACKLLEVGYEFVLEMNGKKLFRKIK